jgi:Flp pilus assembly pilin Flp
MQEGVGEKGGRTRQSLWFRAGSETGASALEYGIVLGILGLVLLLGVGYFYQELADYFSRWGDAIKDMSPPTSGS